MVANFYMNWTNVHDPSYLHTLPEFTFRPEEGSMHSLNLSRGRLHQLPLHLMPSSIICLGHIKQLMLAQNFTCSVRIWFTRSTQNFLIYLCVFSAFLLFLIRMSDHVSTTIDLTGVLSTIFKCISNMRHINIWLLVIHYNLQK